jgi:hypothetical protein
MLETVTIQIFGIAAFERIREIRLLRDQNALAAIFFIVASGGGMVK